MADLSASSENARFVDLVRHRRHGTLKVYIGMIAGVGKTHRMLLEAHELLKLGIDVRIGFIETHGREETQQLTEGLPTIPRRQVYYKGRLLEEMDLEPILRERPEVVLVDELAHSNIPGSGNRKRWEDVLEIRKAGISVITAFNVQHLESMVDRVSKISGIKVEETIPDKILEYADEVVNIDLPAGDLIQRLKDGKIYKGEGIARALDNYFLPETILQLRDLALRQVASQVERKIQRDLPASARMPLETFMACISTNDAGARKIIRKTARLADHYQAEWYVLYVRTSREHPDRIDPAQQRKLLANLRWATELGGRVIIKESTDVPEAIFQTAVEHQITNIVMGRPTFGVLRLLTGRNYFDRFLRRIADTEIDVILVF